MPSTDESIEVVRTTLEGIRNSLRIALSESNTLSPLAHEELRSAYQMVFWMIKQAKGDLSPTFDNPEGLRSVR